MVKNAKQKKAKRGAKKVTAKTKLSAKKIPKVWIVIPPMWMWATTR